MSIERITLSCYNASDSSTMTAPPERELELEVIDGTAFFKLVDPEPANGARRLHADFAVDARSLRDALGLGIVDWDRFGQRKTRS